MITIGVKGQSVFWSDPATVKASANSDSGLWIKGHRCGGCFHNTDCDYVQLYLSLAVFFIHIPCHSPRMTNTGPGERRTTWQPSVLVTRGGWRRTRSRYAPPSWSGKTRRCGSRCPSCGRTAAAARTSLSGMRLSTAHCKELQIKPTKSIYESETQKSLPRRIQHRHKHQGNPFALTSSHCVKLRVLTHTGRLQGMMGAVVTGRPVESAWLLHSERKGMVVDIPVVKHTWKTWPVSRRSQQSQEIWKEQTGRKEL